jgi:hypothetical protein
MADDDLMEHEDKEADVYGDSAREDLLENDEIDGREEAFMDGYEGGEEDEEKVENDKYEKAFEEEDEPAAEEDFEEDY